MEAGEAPGLPLETGSVSCGFKPGAARGQGALPCGPAATLAHVTVSSLSQVITVHIWRPSNQRQQAGLFPVCLANLCNVVYREELGVRSLMPARIFYWILPRAMWAPGESGCERRPAAQIRALESRTRWHHGELLAYLPPFPGGKTVGPEGKLLAEVIGQLLLVQSGQGQTICLLFPAAPHSSASLPFGTRGILSNHLSFLEVRKCRPNWSVVTELVDLYLLWMSRS